jgi:hypothetical protein
LVPEPVRSKIKRLNRQKKIEPIQKPQTTLFCSVRLESRKQENPTNWRVLKILISDKKWQLTIGIKNEKTAVIR